MKTFLNENFLLHSETARELYHDFAETQPILITTTISTQAPLPKTGGSQMGLNFGYLVITTSGVCCVPERCAPYEKSLRWAEVIPQCIGNPLYHWTHLELKRYFGVEEVLTLENASAIRERCNEQITLPDFSARGILRKFRVRAAGTTDDPVDNLRWHRLLAEAGALETQVLPTFRPDKALHLLRPDFTP